MKIFFSAGDIETTPIREGKQKFICGGIYDETSYFFSEDIGEYVNQIKQHSLVYFHNLSYDARFILDELIRQNVPFSLKARGSQILEVTIGKTKLRDSYAIFNMPLEVVAKAFGCGHTKKHIDIEKIEELYATNREEVKEYLKMDCISLYYSLKNFFSLIGLKNPPLTIGCAAKSIWERTNKNVIASSPKYEGIYRRTYFGGRCEVFRKYGRKLFHYDINSLYPFVMRAFPYPLLTPKYDESDNVDDDRMYIAYVEAEVGENEYIPYLPYRYDSRLYFPTGKFDGWYTSVDLKNAVEFSDTKIKIKKKYVFQKTTDNLFTEFVDKFYEMKKQSEREGNKAKFFLSKMMLNSLYGKFGQHHERDVMETCSPERLREHIASNREIYHIHKNIYNIVYTSQQRYSTTYISSFISSYSRSILYATLRKAHTKGEIFYCDTDSVITNVVLPTGKELGEFKLIDEIDEGWFAAPKLYAYMNNKKEVKIKSKGLLSKDISLSDIKNFIQKDVSIVNERVCANTIKKIEKITDCYILRRCIEKKDEKRKFFGIYDSRPYNVKEIQVLERR